LAVHKDIPRLTVAFAGGQLPIAQLSIDGYFGIVVGFGGPHK